MADDRGAGQPSQLRIGCVFGLRNGMFCRVLHTQMDEVIDFSLGGETLKISWALAVRVRFPLSIVQGSFPPVPSILGPRSEEFPAGIPSVRCKGR